ncbi:HAMP domain-containing sensor histidine kinase [Amycolatopsis minnesotensis]|uniref:histidine kinase n=1 Tax=Amycolatopsis minnesotensis TaxID=337894 RepID=A0ABN2SIQ3_9PSEU
MSGLRTTSLYRRVTVTALVVLAVVLVVLGFVVSAVFRAQAERDVNGLLTGRVQLAQQLAKQGAQPQNLVRRVETRGVEGRLTLTDGTVLGAPPRPAEARLRQVKTTLSGRGKVDGAALTVTADESIVAGAESTLRWVLFFTGLAAIAVTAAALLVGVRIALSPLDAMTGLARSIVTGRRGGRLAPSSAKTELGRAASAFDDALDALEGAERAARASEERTRRFVADAAHELRTPIAGVQAAAEAVLQQGPDADPALTERLHLLLARESQRAGKLVSDLLDLAHLDAGVRLEPEPVALLALARAQADRARLLAPELTVEVSGPDTVVLGDSDRLTQVLTNLVDNAVRAMAGRGTLSLTVTESGVTVSDTGPGVPAEDVERIFDRLVRLDDARGQSGAGLGLTIARGFARAHGGDLRYERSGGASFILYGLSKPDSQAGSSSPSSRPE